MGLFGTPAGQLAKMPSSASTVPENSVLSTPPFTPAAELFGSIAVAAASQVGFGIKGVEGVGFMGVLGEFM